MSDLAVNEIFTSVQGEGLNAGLSTVFLRLQGCNLDCTWCDTQKARPRGQSVGIRWGIRPLGERLVSFGIPRVCVTGGEPLLQLESLGGLFEFLGRRKISIEVETNGSRQLTPDQWDILDMADGLVVDFKCPSSGYVTPDWFYDNYLDRLCGSDQVKFVVIDDTDLAFARERIEEIREELKPENDSSGIKMPEIVISPVMFTGVLDPIFGKKVTDFALKHDVRVSVQMHKVLGIP